jgi:hypothetical protein
MSIGPREIACSSVRTVACARAIDPARMVGSARTLGSAWQAGSKATWWSQHREASLNWLALGLLLAAWNASDNDPTAQARRPDSLRGYSYVSVRAQRSTSANKWKFMWPSTDCKVRGS